MKIVELKVRENLNKRKERAKEFNTRQEEITTKMSLLLSKSPSMLKSKPLIASEHESSPASKFHTLASSTQ